MRSFAFSLLPQLKTGRSQAAYGDFFSQIAPQAEKKKRICLLHPYPVFSSCVGRWEKMHLYYFFLSLLHNRKNRDFLMKVRQKKMFLFSRGAIKVLGSGWGRWGDGGVKVGR